MKRPEYALYRYEDARRRRIQQYSDMSVVDGNSKSAWNSSRMTGHDDTTKIFHPWTQLYHTNRSTLQDSGGSGLS